MDRDKKTREYRLFAVRAEDIPENAEFFFLLPEMALMYTQDAPERAVEIGDTAMLPAAAREWLVESIDAIAGRYLAEHEDELLAGTKTFLDRFRLELEREQAAAEKPAKKIRVKARAKGHGQDGQK